MSHLVQNNTEIRILVLLPFSPSAWTPGKLMSLLLVLLIFLVASAQDNIITDSKQSAKKVDINFNQSLVQSCSLQRSDQYLWMKYCSWTLYPHPHFHSVRWLQICSKYKTWQQGYSQALAERPWLSFSYRIHKHLLLPESIIVKGFTAQI